MYFDLICGCFTSIIVLNGNQKIFVWCDFSPEMDRVVTHASLVASILHKDLCLFHHLDKKAKADPVVAEGKLRGLISVLVKESPARKIHQLITHQPLRELLTDFAELYDCILLVAHKKDFPKLQPDLRRSGIPFLFVSSESEIKKNYKQIVVPAGYLKKSKDLALWASYIGRHNEASIDIYAAFESSLTDRKEVQKNLYSIERLYRKFHFPYQIVESKCPTWRLQKNALQYALNFQSGLLVISTSFSTTFLDKLLGLTESRVIQRSENLSVLCINSRRDLYSFCG